MVALFSRRLPPAWEFTPGLPIWRLHPPVAGRIIGEVRDVDAKHASFFALQADSGYCLWRDREFHDPWWVAIERVHGDRLVLHGYVAPDQPILRGVTVVDIPQGAVVYSNPDWTGDLNALAEAGVAPDDSEGSTDTNFPSMYDPQHVRDDWKTLLSFWQEDRIVGGIELVEHGTFAVAAAHVTVGAGDKAVLRHLLKIHDDKTGKVVYEDVLVASAKGIAPDAFFVAENILYYIRERRTLVAVKL